MRECGVVPRDRSPSHPAVHQRRRTGGLPHLPPPPHASSPAAARTLRAGAAVGASGWMQAPRVRESFVGTGAWSPMGFMRGVCATRQPLGARPLSRVIAPSSFRPRQFEYNPHKSDELVLGSISGDVSVLNYHTGAVIGHTRVPGPPHSILGLCWLHKNPSLLISGSDNGIIQLYDVGLMAQGRPPSIYRYEDFEHLTSVHINSEDTHFLVSGYSNDVSLYDLKVGKKLQTFKGLHTQHINVLKFANQDPNLFATSSFDKHIKMWDLRQNVDRPVFEKTSDQGNVMVRFSPCDRYVLSVQPTSQVYNSLYNYITEKTTV
ncbi:WD40-repeat-containing domain protein [Baffinella frigidus]|nr:WD40-repeat-containing domain protein [Cryptophyta sp. CCMP2293]